MGLGSGLAPGPLLGLTLSTALTRGAKAGIQVALSPLVTDTIIIALTLTLVSQLPAVAVTTLTLLGALVVGYFAWETWQAARSPQLAGQLTVDRLSPAEAGEATRATNAAHTAEGAHPAEAAHPAEGAGKTPRPAWLQGILVNFLNPAAWIFWATAGSALLIDFWRTSPLQAVVFLATFYLMLVGTKVLLALGVAAGRERVSMSTYRWLLAASALLLAAVAVGLAASAINSW